jgi:starch phosphorylase
VNWIFEIEPRKEIMSFLQTYQVFPAIPKRIAFLEKLSRNLWWSWQHDANELFRRIDPKLWSKTESNPLTFLSMVPQSRFERLAEDTSFLAHMNRIQERFEALDCLPPEELRSSLPEMSGKIAYFSMEFGIHESLPLFAGGLGILAGDHLKAASDMGLPLVGVGLLYRQGYFFQFLNQEGRQQESYPETDLYHLPVERAKDPSGNEFCVSVMGPDGEIRAAVWRIMVGCIPLYLLDTNLAENPPSIRHITAMLYAGEAKVRLAQELLLGIGGIRALAAMGIYPSVIHMNEGHCAFAGIERLAQTMSTQSVDLKTALEIVPRTTVFTTHTPVAAGYDEFHPDLVRPCLVPFEEKLRISVSEIINLGQLGRTDSREPLSMFVLGVRLSQYCNGVSELHGGVARRMWTHVWPNRSDEEVPITHITNGVHVSSWVSYEFSLLFERYLGPDWALNPFKPELVRRIEDIYDEELWRAHEMNRARLVRTCRELMTRQYNRRNAPRSVMQDVASVLDPDVLTIGFARRFASYKRSYLLLMDPQRLEAILTSEKRPVQILISGKAHPRDREGKDLIQRIFHFAHNEKLRHRFVFLENYDPHIARHLVQGTDVWLNTPRRPMEACGTSGMKAALNGVLNVSVLDGWWCEAYSEEAGWRIGNGEEYDDHHYQDSVESQAVYNVLENEVIPLFYERKNGGVPAKWVKMMKASMKMAIQNFSSHRMITEYGRRFYRPASESNERLLKDGSQVAKRLSAQRERLQAHWRHIRIHPPRMETKNRIRVGDEIELTAEVYLGELRPEEVCVDLYHGALRSIETLADGHADPMTVKEDRGNGHYLYACRLSCGTSGRQGFTARVSPSGDDWIKFTPGLLTWAE